MHAILLTHYLLSSGKCNVEGCSNEILTDLSGHQVKQGAGQEARRNQKVQDVNRLRVQNVSRKLPGGVQPGFLPGVRDEDQRVQNDALEPQSVDHARQRDTPGAPVGGVDGVLESHAAEAEGK